MAGGRPTKYTDIIGNEICEAVSDNPKMLEDLCKENSHWPAAKTIYKWRRMFPEFGKKYTIAKQEQIEPLVSQILHLCEDDSKDYYHDNDGNKVFNQAYFYRLRHKIDSIKWFASKLAPKLYGDKKMEEEDKEDLFSQLKSLAKDSKNG